MTQIEFDFEETPWERVLDRLSPESSFSASQFLTLLEGEDDTAVEEAFQDLEDRGITLDISDLPKASGTGEAAVRLRREEQLAQQGMLLTSLEENDPLRLYLEEIAAIPVCGDPRLLAEESAAGKESAREMLLNLMLSRVVEHAKAHTGRGVLLLDLIQEGSLGLWQAIGSYESGDFEAFADRWICRYMAKAVVLQARQNGVGSKMRRAMEDYRAVDERLLSELGRNATLEEIALELHMSPDETDTVRKMLDSARLVNQAKADTEPEEEKEEEQHVEDTALFQMRQRIADLLADLSEEDSRVLTLRFGLEGGRPLSPEETGKKLNLTPEEVVAREANALAQLRNG